MNIQINTNIDAYPYNCFPKNLEHVPRVGEYVEVLRDFKPDFRVKKLPTLLEVKSVTHSERGVCVDVHYSETDIKAMSLSGVNMFP